MRKNVKFESQRTVFTYSYLHSASYYALEQAKETAEGRTYNCMTSMLYSAFCFEAWLNHCGAEQLNCWDNLERGLRPKEKVIFLSEFVGFQPDFGKRPFQTITDIFRYRNLLVHGQTEVVEDERETQLAEDEVLPYPETSWEKLSTVEMAQRFHEDVEGMITVLHAEANMESSPFGVLSQGSKSVSWQSTTYFSPISRDE